MQLGLHAQGTKKTVLKLLAMQADDQKANYIREAAETKVPLFNDQGPVTRDLPGGKEHVHKNAPLASKTAGPLMDAMLANVAEQLDHCQDDEEVAVTAHITVHRPHQH